MKFQKLSAFEKHFKEAYPKHLSPIYVVVCPQESERKKILSTLASLLLPHADFKRCSQIQEAIEHLNSGSLFSTQMAAEFNGIDQLLKGEMELLGRYIGAPNRGACLVLSSSRMKEVSSLYLKGKQEMVILDLSSEKPWEEKERLRSWIAQVVASEKKRIAPEAIEEMLVRLGSDRILLEQELNKLFCFVKSRQEITLSDVRLLCSEGGEEAAYPLARALVWEGKGFRSEGVEVAFCLQLVGAIRSQLEIGLKMSALLKKGEGEIATAFPRLFPKQLTQCIEGTKRRKEPFFKKALVALFELELGLKSSKGRADILLSQFLAIL